MKIIRRWVYLRKTQVESLTIFFNYGILPLIALRGSFNINRSLPQPSVYFNRKLADNNAFWLQFL
jgi:hypothetical protein